MNKIATKSLHEILVTKAEDHDGLILKIFDVVDHNITVVEFRKEEVEDLYKECSNAFLRTPFNLRVSELLEKVRNNKMGSMIFNQKLEIKFQPENKELAIQLVQEFSDIVDVIEITESQILLNLKERYTCLFP